MWLSWQLISFMAFEKEQSYKHSVMAAFLSVLIRIVFLPVWLVVAILYQAHVILSSRKLRVSATALSPMTMRWLQHQLGLRRDDACAKLIKLLPNHCFAGLYAAAFPVLLGHRLTGFVPNMLRYPYEGIPPASHSSSVRSTFVDAAIERYLPGVEQFVELGAGYDIGVTIGALLVRAGKCESRSLFTTVLIWCAVLGIVLNTLAFAVGRQFETYQ